MSIDAKRILAVSLTILLATSTVFGATNGQARSRDPWLCGDTLRFHGARDRESSSADEAIERVVGFCRRRRPRNPGGGVCQGAERFCGAVANRPGYGPSGHGIGLQCQANRLRPLVSVGMTQLTRRYHFFVTIAIDGDRDTVPSEAEVIDRLTTLLRRDVELNRVIVRSLGTDDHTGQITSSAGQSTTQWRHH